MKNKWGTLSILEKLSFIERLNPTEAGLVFSSIGKKKLLNVLWILGDQFVESQQNLISVTEASDLFKTLPQQHREKLIIWTDES